MGFFEPGVFAHVHPIMRSHLSVEEDHLSEAEAPEPEVLQGNLLSKCCWIYIPGNEAQVLQKTTMCQTVTFGCDGRSVAGTLQHSLC